MLDPGTEKLEELIEKLELYHGAWAVEIKGALYVFPSEVTREGAIEVLKKAYDYYQTRSN